MSITVHEVKHKQENTLHDYTSIEILTENIYSFVCNFVINDIQGFKNQLITIIDENYELSFDVIMDQVIDCVLVFTCLSDEVFYRDYLCELSHIFVENNFISEDTCNQYMTQKQVNYNSIAQQQENISGISTEISNLDGDVSSSKPYRISEEKIIIKYSNSLMSAESLALSLQAFINIHKDNANESSELYINKIEHGSTILEFFNHISNNHDIIGTASLLAHVELKTCYTSLVSTLKLLSTVYANIKAKPKEKKDIMNNFNISNSKLENAKNIMGPATKNISIENSTLSDNTIDNSTITDSTIDKSSHVHIDKSTHIHTDKPVLILQYFSDDIKKEYGINESEIKKSTSLAEEVIAIRTEDEIDEDGPEEQKRDDNADLILTSGRTAGDKRTGWKFIYQNKERSFNVYDDDFLSKVKNNIYQIQGNPKLKAEITFTKQGTTTKTFQLLKVNRYDKDENYYKTENMFDQ